MDWFKNRLKKLIQKLFEKWSQKFWSFVAHRVNEIHNHTTFDGQQLQEVSTASAKFYRCLHLLIKKNILRVGGRLKNANAHPDVKHQVILSSHHHLSKLIISDIHFKNAHIGREHTLYLLRNEYWIPACRGVIRKILSNCLYCKRVNLRPKAQIMANLPKDRLLVYGKPFASTGVE